MSVWQRRSKYCAAKNAAQGAVDNFAAHHSVERGAVRLVLGYDLS